MKPTEIQDWKEFARGLRKRVRWDMEKIDGALEKALGILPGLEEQERSDLLGIAELVAERSGKLALTFLRLAPQAACSIPSSFRPVWMRWAMQLGEHSRETLLDFLEKSPEVFRRIPEKNSSPYLQGGLMLAEKDPAVFYKYFLNLARVSREIPQERFCSWFQEGFDLISTGPSAALAYFAMESKRSWDRAQEEGPSVALEKISRPLKLFAQALTGRNLGLRALRRDEEGRSPLWGLLAFTDGETIFLPEVIGEFATFRLNFLAYKLATAHQAGHVESGTFSFRLSSVQDLFRPEYVRACLKGLSDKGKEVSSLETFFHLFPRKTLAQDLFRILEGARVDHFLRREYRGLKKEIEGFAPAAMSKRGPIHSLPLQEAVLETILRFTVLGESPDGLSWPLFQRGKELIALLLPLLQKGAAVKDSARTTVILYRWLSPIPNHRRSRLIPGEVQEFFPLTNDLPFQDGPVSSRGLQGGEEPYQGVPPVPHWGEIRPEMVHKKLRIQEIRNLLDRMEAGPPLSPEALKELIERGVEWELEIFEGQNEDGSQGLFVTDLKGMKKQFRVKEVARQAREKLKEEMESLLEEVGEEGVHNFFYDEWDYQIGDYRVRWCRVKEREVETGSTEFVDRTLDSYSDLVAEVRRQFQMLKPERFKRIPHLERGEEIDWNAVIESVSDRRAGQSPSEKIYIEKNRKDRDISTLFLLDMSASTDEKVEGKAQEVEPKRVIDIEREALIVMAEALEEIGDEYAIFGFSGYGRKEVDFYGVKDFRENYGDRVKGRVEKMKPQRSTRMGAAIRHAAEKIAGRESRVKNLILLSDGYPQDYDYGEDRSDREYALQDTTVAMEEAARRNIHIFCITVDRAGHDYLRKMLPPSRYLVIEETSALPRELPKIYRRLTT